MKTCWLSVHGSFSRQARRVKMDLWIRIQELDCTLTAAWGRDANTALPCQVWDCWDMTKGGSLVLCC